MKHLKVIIAFILLASFGFAKSNMQFGKNTYLGDNSLIFDVKNSSIKDNQLGSITHKPLIICDHNLSGFIEYTSKTRLTYFASKPLRAGTKYTCKINPKYSNKKSKTTVYTDNFYVSSVNFTSPNVVNLQFSGETTNEEVLKNISLQKVTKLAKSKLSYKIERSDGRNFLLRTNEEAKSIIFDMTKDLKTVHGVKIIGEWHPSLSDEGPSYKTYKDTKTLVLLDEPSWGVKKDGKIVLRIFTPHAFSASQNIRKFINIKGIKNFSVSDYRWTHNEMIKKYSLNDKTYYYMDISGDFKPNTTYKISILSGFGNRYYQLPKEETFKIKTGDFGSYVGFEDKDKPYISSFGDIGITSVNVDKINIIIDKMLDQNLRYFMNLDNQISIKSISKQVINKTFTIGGKRNEYTKHKIPLKEALKGLSKGIYNITIHYGKNKYSSKRVYLSDIGLGAKVYEDGIFVWTSSLKDTSLIKNAKVEVFSNSNMLLASGYTNEFGIYEFNKKDFIQKEPKSVLVTKDGEQNFLLLNKSIGKIDKYNVQKSDKSYNAFIYFQSMLVRPDEDLSTLVVFKDKNYKSLKNAPIRVKIINRMSWETIYDEALKSDEKGAFPLVVPLKGQPTGRYVFQVYFADTLINSKDFLIEAFLPQKIKNTMSLPKGFIKANTFIEANATSRYLFGAPASYLSGSFRLRAVGKDYKNEKFSDYDFNNELLEEKNTITYIDDTKNFALNKNGVAITLLSTHIKQKPPSILDGQVELSVSDDGRKVSKYQNIDIYPYDSMVGLKIKNEIIDTDTPLKVNTILINPFTSKKKNAMLDVYVKERSWYYTYDANGYYKWNKEVNEIEHFTVQSGQDIEKLFSKSGDYIIEVKDSLGEHSASVSFSVRGWDYASLSPTNKINKNQVKYEDKLYKKGDIVKLDIKSPIKTGKMLVTLEGEKILWYKVVDFQNARVKIDVPLNEDLNDGVYIHTIAVRATNSPSNLIPFRASSSSFVKPNRLNHKLNPTIKSKEITKSDTTIPIHVKATPNSKVLISVVDDGILQILDQQPPKPFKFFTKNARKLVSNYDIYDLLMNYITEGKKLNFGSGASAGEMLKKMKKHLSPETGAKRVKPFVYFSKLMDVGNNGEVSVDLKIPSSFNGSATIVAIEISDDKIGANSKKLTIKDDVIIKPIYPRYGNIGDKWSVPIRIFNTTKKSLPITLSASTNKLLHVKGFDESFDLKSNSSKVFYANYEIKDFGKGLATLNAKIPNDTFSYKVELPLIFAYPLSTYNEQGETKTPLTLKAPKEYMKGFTPNFSLSVSGDALSRLRGGSDYLIGYPYGCAEQTSSKILALLNLKPFLDTKNKKLYEAKLKDREKFINEGINKLSTMQNASGSFGYWTSTGYVNTYASIYASDVLFSLKDDKFKIPNYVLKSVKKSLKTFSNLKDNHFNKVYATYLLATQNNVDVANVNYIYDKKIYQDNLPSIYMMAYILKKARMDSEMNAVLKLAYNYDFEKMKSKQREYGRYFYSYPRDIAFALYLHVKHFKKNKSSEALFSKLKKQFKHLYSTQDKALALRALNEYFKGYKKDNNKFIITGGGVDEIYDYEANLEGKYKKNSITLTPKNNWINYNFSVMQYLPKPNKHDKISKKSKKTLQVYRTFVDERGKSIDLANISLGKLIYSKVTLLSNEDIDNVVINEQVPSCFEIVNERVSAPKRVDKVKNSKNFKPDYVDIRDDRILTFLSLKETKSQTFLTPLRATTKGKCLLPPILSEAMYDERINDYDLEVKSVHVK